MMLVLYSGIDGSGWRSFHNSVDNFVAVLDKSSDWDPVVDILQNFERYSKLENYVDSLSKNVLHHLKTSIHKYSRKCHSVNEVAIKTLPFDSPSNGISGGW